MEELEKLTKENQQLKEELNKYTDPKDLTLMFMYCDEKAKDKIKCLEQENQQLKEKLEASEKARKEAIEYIKELYDNTDDTTCYDIDKVEKERLLQILDIDKGE